MSASVGASRVLYPVLSELFDGIDAMGSLPAVVRRRLVACGVGRTDEVLDLACGKGAVALELAASLGCRVIGIDASREFIRAARQRSIVCGVQSRCTFRTGDVRTARTSPVDASVMIGLFGAEEASLILRRRVRPGGVYVFDDAVRDPRHARAARFESTPTLPDLRRVIESRGDLILSARLLPPAAFGSLCKRTVRKLSANARAIGHDRPRLRPALRSFIRTQNRAASVLQGPLRPALFVVRRGQKDRRA